VGARRSSYRGVESWVSSCLEPYFYAFLQNSSYPRGISDVFLPSRVNHREIAHPPKRVLCKSQSFLEQIGLNFGGINTCVVFPQAKYAGVHVTCY